MGPLRSIKMGIDALLEGLDAEPVDDVDEALRRVVAPLEIDVDQPLTTSATSCAGHRRADDLADAGVVALAAADRDLVPLLAVLVDAEDADVADVMVAAGVDAAGDVEVDVRRCRSR